MRDSADPYQSALHIATPREIDIEAETRILVNAILAHPVLEVRKIIRERKRMKEEIYDIHGACDAMREWIEKAPKI